MMQTTDYQAPQIEIYEIAIEKGFSNSMPDIPNGGGF